MARKPGEPITKKAKTIWSITGATLLGCGIAQFAWRNNGDWVADFAIALVVFFGTACGAVGASKFEWKFSRSGGPDSDKSAHRRDRLSLLGWSLLVVAAICTIARHIFWP